MAPLDVDGVGAVAVGTAIFAALTVVALVLRERLSADGNGWWLWVAVTGTLLGLLGLPYVLRRQRVYRAAAAHQDPVPPVAPTA